MLKINFVLEKEVAMYEDDPRILREKNSPVTHSLKKVDGIKIDDEIYKFVTDGKCLEGAKDSIRKYEVHFSGFSVESAEKELDLWGSQYKWWVICNYCGAHAVGEAKISLRKITIYKRPPKGAKDLKIQLNGDENSWYKSPYVYKVRSTSAYCKKCGATE